MTELIELVNEDVIQSTIQTRPMKVSLSQANILKSSSVDEEEYVSSSRKTVNKTKNLKRGYSSMLELKDSTENHSDNFYSLTDALAFKQEQKSVKLPLASFNHIAREVFNLEKSKMFYVDILGFEVIPRPMFDSDGYWLYGYGLSLHLVSTRVPDERKVTKKARIKHFSTQLPRVDHIAFISNNIQAVKNILDHAKVYYKHEITTIAGIEQLFFFDPDGNVLEVSNCAPEIGETVCKLGVSSPPFTLDRQKDAIENIIRRNSEANLEKMVSRRNSIDNLQGSVESFQPYNDDDNTRNKRQ